MFSKIIEKIKEFDTIVIARHIGVDPDALCSQLALRDSIKLTYPDKKVLAIGTGSSKFIHMGRLDKLEKVDNALLIVVDTPDRKRVDSLDFSQGRYSIKIDHHPFIEKYCDFECIMELLEKYPISLKEAYEKLYLRPLSELRLQGYISLNMKVTENGLGYIIITDDVINEFGVDSASAGNIINEFNYIKEVIVWATITEDKKNDQYRVSIRSRGPEINQVAEKYSGGGHKFASGVRPKSLDEVLKLIDDLDLELKNYRSLE